MFSERSKEKELLDLGPEYYTHHEYLQCLNKLFQVNKLFGFFHSTVKILRHFSNESTLLDIGCGGGLFILNLSKLFPRMQMLGVDISTEAIVHAQHSLHTWQRNNPHIQVDFQLQEQTQLDMTENKFDIILATLVCHHLEDQELIQFLKHIYLAANKVVIINELHRHRIAYWFYSLFSPLLFRNRLITHDGLISIRRGFTRKEWRLLLQKAGIQHYQLKWCFPFRWKLILWKE
jgi:2-polyprenyl-3-methyl-5-hydroxy-6-metoxy-1,4-benzoquinol methylase